MTHSTVHPVMNRLIGGVVCRIIPIVHYFKSVCVCCLKSHQNINAVVYNINAFTYYTVIINHDFVLKSSLIGINKFQININPSYKESSTLVHPHRCQ
jgi:hypothetical protein